MRAEKVTNVSSCHSVESKSVREDTTKTPTGPVTAPRGLCDSMEEQNEPYKNRQIALRESRPSAHNDYTLFMKLNSVFHEPTVPTHSPTNLLMEKAPLQKKRYTP
jgi:hypothetical protein